MICNRYTFPDITRSVIIEVRRGVARAYDTQTFLSAEERDEDTDMAVTVDSSVFVQIAREGKNKTTAVLNGEMTAVGRGVTSSIALKKFMDLFDDSDLVVTPPCVICVLIFTFAADTGF